MPYNEEVYIKKEELNMKKAIIGYLLLALGSSVMFFGYDMTSEK